MRAGRRLGIDAPKACFTGWNRSSLRSTRHARSSSCTQIYASCNPPPSLRFSNTVRQSRQWNPCQRQGRTDTLCLAFGASSRAAPRSAKVASFPLIRDDDIDTSAKPWSIISSTANETCDLTTPRYHHLEWAGPPSRRSRYLTSCTYHCASDAISFTRAGASLVIMRVCVAVLLDFMDHVCDPSAGTM